MLRRGKDNAVTLTMAAERQCSRRMPPGMLKRYPHSGGEPVGYVVACPGCGHASTHLYEGDFTEQDGKVTGCNRPLACSICDRVLSIAGGVIAAVLPKALEPCSTTSSSPFFPGSSEPPSGRS